VQRRIKRVDIICKEFVNERRRYNM